MPAWRRKLVTAGANCAGFIMLMLGFRMRVRGRENVAEAKELGAVSQQLLSPLLSSERHQAMVQEYQACSAGGLRPRFWQITDTLAMSAPHTTCIIASVCLANMSPLQACNMLFGSRAKASS